MKRLFENCGILAWKDDKFHYIPKGFLGVDGDTICYVGDVRPEGGFDDVRDVSGKLLMPGLIDCHCHTAMTLLRGVGSDLPLQEWLFDKVFPIEDRMTPEIIAAGNELAMLELIASGVTSFTDMYMEAATTPKAMRVNRKLTQKVAVCTKGIKNAIRMYRNSSTPRPIIQRIISLFIFIILSSSVLPYGTVPVLVCPALFPLFPVCLC